MRTINRELKSSMPDMDLVAGQSKMIISLAAQLDRWFPPGSGPDSGVTTRASPDIWSKTEAFRMAAQKFVASAQSLDATSSKGDASAVREQLEDVSQSCRSCHDDFRTRSSWW